MWVVFWVCHRLGLYVLGQARDSFWSYFASGKDFGKRATMWDIFFSMFNGLGGGSSRDEEGLVVSREFGWRVGTLCDQLCM